MSVLTELKNSSRLAVDLVIACALTFTIVAPTLAQEKAETGHLIGAGSSDTEAEISTFRFASPAEGICGKITVTVIERAKDSDSNWTLRNNTIYTNKSDYVCSKLDDHELSYDWKPVQHFFGCDYIEFEAL